VRARRAAHGASVLTERLGTLRPGVEIGRHSPVEPWNSGNDEAEGRELSTIKSSQRGQRLEPDMRPNERR